MKCPKCGFQSFNYLATCKKCGRDLSEIRDRLGLGDPVVPGSHARYAEGSARPVVEDPFDTTLPDEKDISTAAEMATLTEEETDADLADYFEELGTVDEELAATLDPDMEWEENAVTADSFLVEEDPAEPVLAGEETLPDLDREESVANPEPVQDLADEDAALEAVEELDDWLLEGEDLPWRRSTSDAVSDDNEGVVASVQESPEGENTPIVERFPTDFPEQADLPFADAVESASPRVSLATRALALVLDTGLLAAVFVLFVLAGDYLRQGMGGFTWPQPQNLAAQIGPYFLVFFGLSFGYFTLFHYLGGQTPGKMAGKLLVIDIAGEPLQLSQAFLRTVGGLICLLPAGLGFCSMLFNRERRGWNDRLAGSVVVAAGEDEVSGEAG